MAEKKLTKKEKFEILLEIGEVQANSVLVDFLQNEIKLLEKKANSRGSSANQAENEEIKQMILKAMEEKGVPVTISDLLEVEEMAEYRTKKGDKLSNQKVSALMKQLKDTNVVSNFKDKKKSLFTLVTD